MSDKAKSEKGLVARRSAEEVDEVIADVRESGHRSLQKMILATEVLALREELCQWGELADFLVGLAPEPDTELQRLRLALSRVVRECVRAAPPPRDPSKYIVTVGAILNAISGKS